MEFFPCYLISDDIEADIKDVTLMELYGPEYYKGLVESTYHLSYSCNDLELAYSEVPNYDGRGNSMKLIRKQSMKFKPKGSGVVYKLARGPIEIEEDRGYIDQDEQGSSESGDSMIAPSSTEMSVELLGNLKGVREIPSRRKIKSAPEEKREPANGDNKQAPDTAKKTTKRTKKEVAVGSEAKAETTQSLSLMFGTEKEELPRRESQRPTAQQSNQAAKGEPKTTKQPPVQRSQKSGQQTQTASQADKSGQQGTTTKTTTTTTLPSSTTNATATTTATANQQQPGISALEMQHRIENDSLTVMQTLCAHAPFLNCYPNSFMAISQDVRQEMATMTAQNAKILRMTIDHESHPTTLINIRGALKEQPDWTDRLAPEISDERLNQVSRLCSKIFELVDAFISRLLALSVNDKHIDRLTESTQAFTVVLVSSKSIQEVLKYNKFLKVTIPFSQAHAELMGPEYSNINMFKLIPGVILHTMLNDLEGTTIKTRGFRRNIAELIVRASKMRNCSRYLSYSISQQLPESCTPSEFIDFLFPAVGPGNIKVSDLVSLDLSSVNLPAWDLEPWFAMMKTIYKQFDSFVSLRKKLSVVPEDNPYSFTSADEILFEIINDYATRKCGSKWNREFKALILFVIQSLK